MVLLSRFTIVGHSMIPTFIPGETVLVSSLPYLFSKPKINDIVVFRKKKSGKIFIKRIAKINPSTKGNKYFVKGDNKKDSLDSRGLGWVKRQDILGKAITLHTTVYRG